MFRHRQNTLAFHAITSTCNLQFCIYNRRSRDSARNFSIDSRKIGEKHHAQELEIRECFINHDGKYLEDTREDHLTDPPTLWFIGRSYRGRELKIIFVHRDKNIYIKSAYEADSEAKRIYTKLTKPQGE